MLTFTLHRRGECTGELKKLHKMDICGPLLFSFTHYSYIIPTLYAPNGRSRRGTSGYPSVHSNWIKAVYDFT
jgi:hypothetical protein